MTESRQTTDSAQPKLADANRELTHPQNFGHEGAGWTPCTDPVPTEWATG